MKRLSLLACVILIGLGAKAPPDPSRFVSNATKSREQFVFNAIPSLVNIEFPKLTAFTGEGGLWVWNCPNLTSVLFPKAVSFSNFVVNGNAAIMRLSFPSLMQVDHFSVCCNDSLVAFEASLLGDVIHWIEIRNNHALTFLSLPNLRPLNGSNLVFYDNALDQVSVDGLIQRCVDSIEFVSGTLNIGGGANSPPSAAGMANLQLLLDRGVTVGFNP